MVSAGEVKQVTLSTPATCRVTITETTADEYGGGNVTYEGTVREGVAFTVPSNASEADIQHAAKSAFENWKKTLQEPKGCTLQNPLERKVRVEIDIYGSFLDKDLPEMTVLFSAAQLLDAKQGAQAIKERIKEALQAEGGICRTRQSDVHQIERVVGAGKSVSRILDRVEVSCDGKKAKPKARARISFTGKI